MNFANVFATLSDPIRREILELLKEGPLNAGEIASHFDVTQAAISYHLAKLKKADLVSEIKVKNFIYYELNMSIFQEVISWLSQFHKGDE